MFDSVNKAVEKITAGQTPKVRFEETYALHKKLIQKGLILEMGAHKYRLPQKTFSYQFTIKTNTGKETYLSTWKEGRITPKHKLLNK